MKRLCFEDYEDFICEVDDKFEMIREFNECADISIVAKYNEAKEIIKELLSWDYNIATIHIANEESEGYKNEFIISIVNLDGDAEIWCEPMKDGFTYLDDDSVITYIMDNCSSACIEHCKANAVFEVAVGCDEDCECNGDECCECDECNENTNTECAVKHDDDGYIITVKYNLDADEAMEMIKDMEKKMEHMNDMFREMDEWRKLFRW